MQKRLVDVRELTREQPEELGEEQAEGVKGGSAGILVGMGDGSVRMTDIRDGTSNTFVMGDGSVRFLKAGLG